MAQPIRSTWMLKIIFSACKGLRASHEAMLEIPDLNYKEEDSMRTSCCVLAILSWMTLTGKKKWTGSLSGATPE